MSVILLYLLLTCTSEDVEFMSDDDSYTLYGTMLEDAPVNRVRVLTLNLFLRPPLVKNNESDFKDARTSLFLLDFLPNYDLICLQEVFGFMNYRKTQLIEEAKIAGFPYFAESPVPGGFSGYLIDGGLLILSRLPIVERDFKVYQDSAMPDSLAQKGVLYCRIKVGELDLHVFATHAQSSYETTDQDLYLLYRETRRLQFQEIREFIFETTRDQGFIMLLGDLNVDSREGVKPAPFPEVPLDDYDTMMDIFGPGAVDLLYQNYGFHPITFGKRLPDGTPEETVLSDQQEQGQESSLDFIIVFSESRLKALRNETKVQEFYVQNQPFIQISDHYGVETVLYTD